MHKLIEYICDELEGLEKKSEKGSLSMSELQYADTLAHLKKNLLKSEEMMEEFDEGYSSEMRPMTSVGGSYRGGSYRDGGMSYARGRGRNARRDSMGRYSSERGYSRTGDVDEMVESIRGMMGELPQEVQRDAQKLIQKMEQMM
jgi:hypothetical protein